MPPTDDTATMQMIVDSISTLTNRFDSMERNLREDLRLINGKMDTTVSKPACREIRQRIESDRQNMDKKVDTKMDKSTVWHVAGFVGVVVGLILTGLSVIWNLMKG